MVIIIFISITNLIRFVIVTRGGASRFACCRSRENLSYSWSIYGPQSSHTDSSLNMLWASYSNFIAINIKMIHINGDQRSKSTPIQVIIQSISNLTGSHASCQIHTNVEHVVIVHIVGEKESIAAIIVTIKVIY